MLIGLTAATVAFPLVLAPKWGLAALLVVMLVVVVVAHPPIAAYALAGTSVLIAGIERGALLPVLRPSEALLLVLGLALAARSLIRAVNGSPGRIAFTKVDGSLLLLAVASSVIPLLWMGFRGKPVTRDDLLFALALWKVYAVFVVFRTSVRTNEQIMRCLWLSMSAATVVAVIAVLQALDLFGVRELVLTYYSPSEQVGLDPGRGSSTLGSALVTGNVMAFNFAIALSCLARLREHRLPLLAAATTFIFGGLATGQFSTVIGLAVVAIAVGVVTGQLTRRLLGLATAGLVAALFLQPVIGRRLAAFRSGTRVPSSWLARLDNLRTYFWPELFSDFNYVLGVRPAPRVPYRGSGEIYVWIESGYTWLLWAGGLPMLLAFFVFVWTTGTILFSIAKRATDATGVAALAAFAALSVAVVLMTFDPQLTGRGEAEVLFSLIGLALISGARPPSVAPWRPADVSPSTRSQPPPADDFVT